MGGASQVLPLQKRWEGLSHAGRGAHTVFELVLTQTFKVLGLVLLVLVNLFILG